MAFIVSKKISNDASTSDVIDDSSWLSTFYRIVSGINGLCFLILTVCMLNYGSRLEKIVHAIKVKGQHQQASNELTNQIGLSGSSRGLHRENFNQVDLVQELPQINAEPNQNKIMTSLDVRIFVVTIFLSVVLLAVSVTELLCCFKIIRDIASLAEWKFLLYYLMSEQFPSIVITSFFNSTKQDESDALHEVEGLYQGDKNQSSKRRSRRQ